jgi:hypothetical protein
VIVVFIKVLLVCLYEATEANHETQDGYTCGRNLNHVPPEYEAGAQSACLFSFVYIMLKQMWTGYLNVYKSTCSYCIQETIDFKLECVGLELYPQRSRIWRHCVCGQRLALREIISLITAPASGCSIFGNQRGVNLETDAATLRPLHAPEACKVKGKWSRYTPCRRLGWEEVQLLLILNLGTRWGWVKHVRYKSYRICACISRT